MKILFINPSSEHIVRMEMSENVIEQMGYFPPLGILYIATYLKKMSKKKIDVKIIDCIAEKVGYESLKKIISEYNPDIAAITTFTPSIVDGLLTCTLVKKVNPKIITVLGGHHVDSYPEESVGMPDVDFILRGEGEEAMLKLVDRIAENKNDFSGIEGLGYVKDGKKIVDLRFPVIKNLDDLPIPDRTLINNDLYTCTLGSEEKLATIMSSRGCPYQCTFCYCPTKNYRFRSVASIVEELKDVKNMGFKEVFFFDDLFNLSAERVINISNAMLENNLRFKWSFRGRVNHITDQMLKTAKKSGCERIHYGIETSDDTRLKRIKKNTNIEMIEKAVKLTHKHRIQTVGNFMIGLPGETKDDIYKTFQFMVKLDLNFVEISVLMPYPNTELYKEGLKNGIIKSDFWKYFSEDPLDRIKNFKPQVWTEILPQDELFKLVNVGYSRFYMRPSYVLKSLLHVRSAKELTSKARAGFVLLKEILGGK